MTTPAETPEAKNPDDNSCPRWNGAEPHSFVAQKAPQFPVFIRACSSCGRIDFGELARDLAGYVVVPQAEHARLEVAASELKAADKLLAMVSPDDGDTHHVVSSAIIRVADRSKTCDVAASVLKALADMFNPLSDAYRLRLEDFQDEATPAKAPSEPPPEGPRGVAGVAKLSAADAAHMNAAVSVPDQPAYDWTGVLADDGDLSDHPDHPENQGRHGKHCGIEGCGPDCPYADSNEGETQP